MVRMILSQSVSHVTQFRPLPKGKTPQALSRDLAHLKTDDPIRSSEQCEMQVAYIFRPLLVVCF